ncbi:hypothetical protein [Dactylosporangium sp. CA-139066]|uniref:hypothetical protein n=1 Tax=Dactylosporangium sp. CA-139066 TaxID=3239930 RepID=UPI003D8BD554
MAEERLYPGPVRIAVCKALAGQKWLDLARYLEVPADVYATAPADEKIPRIWDWLEGEGRLGELEAALASLGWTPVLDRLREAAEERRRSRLAFTIPEQHRSLTTTYFDLKQVRAALLRARDRSPVQLFALPHPDVRIGHKLMEWVTAVYHPIKDKGNLSLGTLASTADTVARAILRHRTELRHTDLARHIDAIRAPTPVLQRLVERLEGQFDAGGFQLMLLVTVTPDVQLPAAMHPLPAPVVVREDIEYWTAEAAGVLRVPDAWRAWSELICAYAAEENDALNPGSVFESMDRDIKEIHDDIETFVNYLKGAGRDA